MSQIHYYVLVRKTLHESGDVLGFYNSKEEAETAKSQSDYPENELHIIETDSSLKVV